MSKTSSIFKNVAILGVKLKKNGNLTGVKDSMSWKIFGQPSRKKRGLFGLWRRRRTKEEEKSIGEQKRGGGRK